MPAKLRCAIYTRKSSEEGLDQSFNSLHAQREAGEAYVLSQAGEGWSVIRTLYDDGGYSGGSMERPALKQLLNDISRGQVDIVVVYKVDRLTRSLADFAKIVELFDAKGVSFVSVTQAFNTTTSTGRLTLNVLLSFAQFEREVTGERIRDKIAASKAKGLRMGGRPPLGYDLRDLRLVVNEREAEVVRQIFNRYVELGSVFALEAALAAEGISSKRWVKKDGREHGGVRLSRGALYHLLSNPVYRGANRHKDKLYENAHPAIVDEPLWMAVRAKLADTNASRPSAPKAGEAALFDGLLVDDRGGPMIVVHTTRGSKRYRYYVSRAKLTRTGEPGTLPRLAAGMLDKFVADRLSPGLSPSWRTGEPEGERLRAALVKLRLSADRVVAVVCGEALRNGNSLAPVSLAQPGQVEVQFPLYIKIRQGALIIGGASSKDADPRKIDRTLVRTVVLARHWAHQLETGQAESVKALARQNGLCEHYTMRLAPLAYLAPDIAAAILEGRQPRALSLAALTNQPLPLSWDDQRRLLQSLC